MILQLHFKTPDVVDYAIDDACGHENGDTNERVEFEAVCEKFVEYGENLTVELDTEAGTATAEYGGWGLSAPEFSKRELTMKDIYHG